MIGRPAGRRGRAASPPPVTVTPLSGLLAALLSVLVVGCQNTDLNSGPALEAEVVPVPVDPCPPPVGLDVVINEVMLVNLGAVTGPEGLQPWIELHNPTLETFDLGGLTISDDITDPEKWEFPCGGDELLDPGEHLVLFFSDAQLSDTDLVIDFLPADTGLVQLSLYWDGAADQTPPIDADLLTPGGSIGWSPDVVTGAFVELLSPTPGESNSEPLEAPPATFVRGDLDGDLDVDATDLGLLQQLLFEESTPLPACVDRADVNDDGLLDIADLNFLVLALEPGGPSIPPPFLAPDVDPTDDGLPCEHEVIP